MNEVTLAAEQPVLSVVLYGTVPERTTVLIARQLRDKLESFRQILSVDIAGDREEIVEIIVDPLLMESYGLDQSDIYNLIALNSQWSPPDLSSQVMAAFRSKCLPCLNH